MNDKSMVSFYKNVVDTKGTPVSASSILAAIRDGKWAKQITILRMMQDEKAQKTFKNTLPCYTPSGLFSERNAESLKSHSGVLLLDVDPKDNPCLVENFKEIRNKLNADQYTYYLFESCRGNGLALGVRIDPGKHLESFLFLERYYMEKYELVVDKGCKDVCRLRFISYDPELFINEKAEIVVPDVSGVKNTAVTTRHDQTSNGKMSDRETMDDIIASGVTLVDDHQHGVRVKIAHALSTAFGEYLGRMYTHSILSKCADYDRETTDKYFTGIHKNNKGTVKFRSIVFLAKQAGYTPTRKGKMNIAKSMFEEITEADVGQDKQKFSNTDVGNGERLVEKYGDKIRYCYALKKWLIYDSKRWEKDDSGKIMQYAKATAKSIFREAANSGDTDVQKAIVKFTFKTQAKERLLAMVELAKSEPGIPISPGELDVDHYLLNFLNGTLNLKTETLQPHDPANFITKLIPIKYDPGAMCPAWIDFLETIFNWNYDIIRFIQWAIGYSLTGLTSEQCFFLLHGAGANGKSTLLNMINALLGEYAQTAIFDTFLAKKEERSVNNDIARMQGKRFVSAIESEGERRLSEVLIKQLTGGDTITARFLFAEFFEFQPQFKIWLACNHKPVVRGTDHAIWRRIKLIPFNVTIPEADRDKNMLDKLKKELPGILAWAVQGCLEWQKNGLQTPDDVEAATGEYQTDMDIIQAFLVDKCFVALDSPDVKTPSGALYEAYAKWCAENGETPLNNKSFGRRLVEKGFSTKQSGGKRWMRGIGLRTSAAGGFDSENEN